MALIVWAVTAAAAGQDAPPLASQLTLYAMVAFTAAVVSCQNRPLAMAVVPSLW